MNSAHQTACCGIYCPDCIRFQNRFHIHARQLKNELDAIGFHQYAKITVPGGDNFNPYAEFMEVLTALANTQCDKPCRVGGGCSGTPCKIMECCVSNGYAGCWECDTMESCEKFDILRPRCGEMPKNNVRKIKEHGIENWIEMRDTFYIWEK